MLQDGDSRVQSFLTSEVVAGCDEVVAKVPKKPVEVSEEKKADKRSLVLDLFGFSEKQFQSPTPKQVRKTLAGSSNATKLLAQAFSQLVFESNPKIKINPGREVVKYDPYAYDDDVFVVAPSVEEHRERDPMFPQEIGLVARSLFKSDPEYHDPRAVEARNVEVRKLVGEGVWALKAV